MPFAFKLACRLARLKHRTLAGAAAAVAAAVVLSCELPVQVATPNATVSQLIITPHAVTLQLNQDQDFVAVGLSAAGDTTPSTVNWDVTGGTITDMGSSHGRHYGQYHGGTCGSFKVAATSHPDRTTDTATVTVAGCVAPVAAVTVSPAAPTGQVGQTAQLTATPRDASGNPLTGRVITWQSSNGAVASVNGSGLVTAVATGSATITATSEGQSGTAVVTVSNVPVASVTVTPASASVQQGATVQLTATPRDANGTALTGRVVTWGSNNTAVATVSSSGLVSGAGGAGRRGGAAPQPPGPRPGRLPRPGCGGRERLGAAGQSREDRADGAGGVGDGHPGDGQPASRADGAAHGHAPGRERQSVDR